MLFSCPLDHTTFPWELQSSSLAVARCVSTRLFGQLAVESTILSWSLAEIATTVLHGPASARILCRHFAVVHRMPISAAKAHRASTFLTLKWDLAELLWQFWSDLIALFALSSKETTRANTFGRWNIDMKVCEIRRHAWNAHGKLKHRHLRTDWSDLFAKNVWLRLIYSCSISVLSCPFAQAWKRASSVI